VLGSELQMRLMFKEAEPHFVPALAAARQALKLAPGNPAARDLVAQCVLGVCACRLDAGDYTAAGALATEAAADFAKKAASQAQLAAVLGRCVNLVLADTTLSKAEQAELAQRYGDLALAALRQAVDLGYTDVGTLKTGLAFEGLRGRDDFQKLIKELEGKKKSGEW
jgi:hypothetical protein